MSHPSDRGFELFRRDPGVKRRRELGVEAIRQTEPENKEIGFVGGATNKAQCMERFISQEMKHPSRPTRETG